MSASTPSPALAETGRALAETGRALAETGRALTETRRSESRVPSLKRALATLLLPLSMVPVVLLAPSLFRAPAVLVRHAAHALAPAQTSVRRRRAPRGPSYYLVGPARFEIEAFESAAGAMTPKVGVSPLDEPEWAARAAAEGGDPVVLRARGREVTDASGQPLRTPGAAAR